MMARAAFLLLALVGACDARPHLIASVPEAEPATPAHAVTPAPELAAAPEVVAAACEAATEDGPIVMAAHGTVGAYTIYAQRGVLECGGAGPGGAIECVATGPGQFGAAGPRQTIYALERDQSATLVVDRSGAACHLNEGGE